jgi:hypothetical protein
MFVEIKMTLSVPDNFDICQIQEDVENAIMYKTCFDVEEIDCDTIESNDNKELKIQVPFVSVWSCGTEIETHGYVNIKTCEVTDVEIDTSVNVDSESVLEEQYIVMNDVTIYVYEDERGFDYWADLKGEM